MPSCGADANRRLGGGDSCYHGPVIRLACGRLEVTAGALGVVAACREPGPGWQPLRRGSWSWHRHGWEWMRGPESGNWPWWKPARMRVTSGQEETIERLRALGYIR